MLISIGIYVVSLRAQNGSDFNGQNFGSRPVARVEFEPANQPIDPRDLARMQMVQIGSPLESRYIAATLDRLFSTGLYDDLKVDVEESRDGHVVRFLTTPRRFVGHVDAQGQISDPPNRAVVISDSQLTLGTPYDEDSLVAARDNILAEMRRNGLYQAKVDYATIEDPLTHQVTIRFLVDAGKRAKYEEPKIEGNPKISDSTIIRATGWRLPLVKRWRRVTQSLTDKGTDAVQRKYAAKDRLTTSVDVASLDYRRDTNTLKPTLDIQAGPRIEVKALEAKIPKSKIRKYVPIYEEGSVDRDLLTEGARNLHDYFQGRGYPDVDVTFRLGNVENDHQTITYYINTGSRQKLVSVKVEGNDYFLPETIEERTFLRTKSLVLRYGRYSEAFRHQDEEAIDSLFQANGFRESKTRSVVDTNYGGKENQLGVRFIINHGSQWRVANLRIDGAARLDLTPVQAKLTSTVGQPFAEVNIANDRNLIMEHYFAHGFPNATFRDEIKPGLQPHTVDLVYTVREGPQQFVKDIIISGIDRTRPSLVQPRIAIQPGEPVSLVKINDIARQLNDLGVFQSVNSGVQDSAGTTEYKTVVYDFDEAARYTMSVSYGLQVGTFGGTTSNLNNAGGARGVSPIVGFDVNRINFMGRGQTVGLQTRYSRFEQRYALNYIIPRFLGSANRTVTASLLYNSTRDVQTFSSRRAEASLSTSQRLSRASTIVVRAAYRQVKSTDIQIPSLLIPALLQSARIGIISASYIQDHRDNPADAHHGFWNTIDAGLSGNFFGSNRSFYRVLARNATYTQITRNLVLARQTQYGAVVPFHKDPNAGLNDLQSIPLPERFFGGGGVSMRGFGYNQAGPRDIGTLSQLPGPVTSTPTGFPIGGNGLLFNNVELRFPLLGPNVTGVAFHDMGNIYTTPGDISLRYKQRGSQDFNYALQAAGFGIRYKTPLGPVRVDLAYALNPTNYQGFSRNETIQDLLKCRPIDLNPPPGYIPNSACVASPQKLSRVQFFFSIGQAF